jgi:hypothetical protein
LTGFKREKGYWRILGGRRDRTEVVERLGYLWNFRIDDKESADVSRLGDGLVLE